MIAHRQGQGPLVVLGAPGTGKTRTLVAGGRRPGGPRRSSRPTACSCWPRPGRPRRRLRSALSARLGRTVREPLARTPHSYAFGLLRRARVLEGDAAAAAPVRRRAGPGAGRAARRSRRRARAVHRPGRPRSARRCWPLRGFRDELRDLLMRAVERGLAPADLADLGRAAGPAGLGRRRRRAGRVPRRDRAGHPRRLRPGRDRGRRGRAAGRATTRAARRRARRLALVAVDDAQELDAAAGRLLDLIAGQAATCSWPATRTPPPSASAAPCPVSWPRPPRRAGRGTAAPRPATTLTLRTVRPARARPAGGGGAGGASRIGSAGPRSCSGARPRRCRAGRRHGSAVHLLASPAQEAAFVAQELRRRAPARTRLPWSAMAVVVRSHPRHPCAAPGPGRGRGAGRPSRRRSCRSATSRRSGRCGWPCAAVLRPDSLTAGVRGGAADRTDRRRATRSRCAGCAARCGPRSWPAAAPGPATSCSSRRSARRSCWLPWTGGRRAGPAGGRRAGRRPGRWRRPAASAEPVLWALWEATGLAEPWRRTALAGGPAGAAGRPRPGRGDGAVRGRPPASPTGCRRPAPAEFLDAPGGAGRARRTPWPSGPPPTTPSPAHAARRGRPGVGRGRGRRRPGGPVAGPAAARVAARRPGPGRPADGRERPVPGGQAAGQQRRAVLDDELRLFHVAVTRARRHLLVTAVRSEDEMPSPFLDLVDAGPRRPGEVRPLTAVPADADAARAGGGAAGQRRRPAGGRAPPDRGRRVQLARLAAAGVPGADPERLVRPGRRLGARPAAPARRAGPGLPVQVESFQRCALRWLLEHRRRPVGGPAPQVVGTLVHEIAHARPGRRRGAAARELLASGWRRSALGDRAGWPGGHGRGPSRCWTSWPTTWPRRRRRAASWSASSARSGCRVGRAEVRGTVDRLERDGEGRLVVVDLKTGRTTPRPADLPRHPQLGVYQVIAEEGGFEGVEAAGVRRRLAGPARHRRPSGSGCMPQPAAAADDDPQWAGTLWSSRSPTGWPASSSRPPATRCAGSARCGAAARCRPRAGRCGRDRCGDDRPRQGATAARVRPASCPTRRPPRHRRVPPRPRPGADLRNARWSATEIARLLGRPAPTAEQVAVIEAPVAAAAGRRRGRLGQDRDDGGPGGLAGRQRPGPHRRGSSA